jgi:glutathione S-transferase
MVGAIPLGEAFLVVNRRGIARMVRALVANRRGIARMARALVANRRGIARMVRALVANRRAIFTDVRPSAARAPSLTTRKASLTTRVPTIPRDAGATLAHGGRGETPSQGILGGLSALPSCRRLQQPAARPSPMADFTLYAEPFYFSPYVFSSFVALREKNVLFDVVEVALAGGEQELPRYATPSVTGRIPSLDHAGFRLAESSAIAEYLEDVLPPPAHPRLLPAPVRDRARARQVMAWLRSDLGALREERSTATMFYRFRLRPLSDAALKDAQRLLRVAEQLVPASGGPLFGEWSLVDAELAFTLHRLILNADAVPERVAAYARAQWGRPSVREFVEHPRPTDVAQQYWPYGGTVRPEPR